MSGTGKTLKSRVWRATQPVAIAAGRWNATARVLPDFLIVGGQRCGTTSLHEWLDRHPAVRFPRLGKGVHYFDTASEHSLSWYRAHFPTRRSVDRLRSDRGGVAVGEASPYYLFHPAVPGRVAAAVPEAKIIAVLRDPVTRAWSHYQHEVRRGHEQRPFEVAIEQEAATLAAISDADLARPGFVSYEHQHHSYVARGRYSEQLQRWFDAVGWEQVLVLVNHELFAQDGSGGRRVLEFLGLESLDLGSFPRENATAGGSMSDAARSLLVELLGDEAERTSAVVRREVRWSP